MNPNIWQTLPRGEDAGRRRALGLVSCAVFDSADHPEASRAAAYQGLLSPARVTPMAEPFRAHAVVYGLGDVQIGLFDGVPHRLERDRGKIAFDGADGIALHHIVRGHAAGTFDGVDVMAGEGSVYGFDMARPAEVEERGAMRSIRVGLRRHAAVLSLAPVERLHGAALDRRGAAPFLRVLYDLVPRLGTLPAAQAPRHVAELLAALSRCLDAAAPRAGTDKRDAVLDFIDRHVSDRRLGPDFIAGSLRISRSALFSASREWGGVERAILRRRLDRARMILMQSGPRPSVAQLAHQCGFASPEHFARVFRQHYGAAPSRYGTGIAVTAEPFAGSDESRSRSGGTT